MTYYIKPSTIFWINMADRFLILLILTAIFAFIGSIAFVIAYNEYWDNDHEEEEKKLKLFKKMAKVCTVIGIIATLAAVFLPSKKLFTEMYVASVVTEENVDSTKQEVIEIIDHIIDKLEGNKSE